MSDEQQDTTALLHQEQPATAVSTATAVDPNAAPPAGEEIHLPPGSPIPLLIAVGITMTIVGVTIGWIWTILGGILFIVCLVLWIRDTIREVDHLPDELGHGH